MPGYTPLRFRKFPGKTLPQVIFADPDFFFWLHSRGTLYGTLRREADEIYRKATSIRLPQPGMVAEYNFHPVAGFCGVDLVPVDRPAHEGCTRTLRLPVFDLSITSRARAYDKGGGKILVNAVKFHLFGDSHRRMTRQRCEDFFDNEANFARPAQRPMPGQEPQHA